MKTFLMENGVVHAVALGDPYFCKNYIPLYKVHN